MMMSEMTSSYDSIVDLMKNKSIPESELISQLQAILNDNPGVVHEKNCRGHTLLHHAAISGRSPEFCQVLLSQNKDLVRTAGNMGVLPFHFACCRVNVETAKYLFKLYPESISIPGGGYGMSPLHMVLSKSKRENKIELVKFLLDNDPTLASTPDANKRLPLHMAIENSDRQIPSCFTILLGNSDAVVMLVFNAYPEAIHIADNYGSTPLDYARRTRNRNETVDFFFSSFLEQQMELERQAHNHRTPDSNGQLPIHRALCGGASVGGIKLMLAANLASTSMPDSQGHTPIHIACQIGNLGAAKYLIKVDQDLLQATDTNGNLPLHLACMRGNSKVISCILEQSTYGVTLQNSGKHTPIELLLFESQHDRNSMDYIEAVRCLLYVNPVETLKCLVKSENGKLISEILE